MEKQLLARIKKLEQNVVNLYHIQGTGKGSIATTANRTIYSTSPDTNFGIAVPIESIILGINAGSNSIDANASIILGDAAGMESQGAVNSIFMGSDSGKSAVDATSSNFLGLQAGASTTLCNNSNFLGGSSGFEAINAYNCNFFGFQTGAYSENNSASNFMGASAGRGATGSDNSNFFGENSGFSAFNSHSSNFLGDRAGVSTNNAYRCNFFGAKAGSSSSGNNVNAFGYEAGLNNTLSNQTIFSNTSLHSYADRVAAIAAITVLNGASAGSTYLYYNATTLAIEAIRLED